MGEVYRARDSKLRREVAIKVLPEAVAEDAERLARFQREAEVLAALNHPHIAAIYGLEESDGVPALVLELVEGETLAERIAAGPIPVEEALGIARQIADALEAAHEKGIVHRDLKPANVKLTPGGKIKVLDFGLAKALTGDSSSPDVTSSPTLTARSTQAGMIIGTAAYMSPEQARGKSVDKRADVWAFGALVYEMLTGRRAFEGDTVSDTLAAVLKTDPNWEALPAETPATVRKALRRCLERDRDRRLHDIADARIEMEEGSTAGVESMEGRVAARRPNAWTAALVGLAAGAALAAAILLGLRRPLPPAARLQSRLSVRLPPGAPYRVDSYPGDSIAISRDGSRIAYSSPMLEGSQTLHIRRLDDLEVRPLAGTEGTAQQPFLSPDGEWIGYFARDSLRKVSARGGSPVTLVHDLPNAPWLRGSWSDDGRIVYDTWNAGLRIVAAEGGATRVLTQPDSEWNLGPEVLPGSDTVLYFAQTATSFRIESVSLDGKNRKTILENASHPRCLASGHLLFVRDGGLMLAPFDAGALRVTGPAVPVPLNVMMDHPNVGAPLPQLAVSREGTLVYAPSRRAGARQSTLVWVDRAGKSEEIATVPFAWPHFDLSRDDGRLALSGRDGGLVRIEIFDLARKTLTPLREERLDYPAMPVWSPDGSRIFFSRFGTHESALLTQSVDGGAPQSLLTLPGTWMAPRTFSRDGRFLAISVYNPKTGSDIWVLDLAAPKGEKPARAFLDIAGDQFCPALSPDGKWLAYASSETGRDEIYLRRFPGGEGKVRISSDGGFAPLWSSDGRELFFQSQDGSTMMAVSIETRPTLRLGQPQRLFEGHFQSSSDVGLSFAVSPDSRRFLMVRQDESPREATELVVVQNWFQEIERLTAAGGVKP
jgi:serine/threonine-protein kinase